jgi:hypothetical protein
MVVMFGCAASNGMISAPAEYVPVYHAHCLLDYSAGSDAQNNASTALQVCLVLSDKNMLVSVNTYSQGVLTNKTVSTWLRLRPSTASSGR